MARLSHEHRNAKASTRYGSGDLMPARHRVAARSIPCPDCSAAVGESCLSSNGRAMGPHASRQRMATRKANESQTWDLVAAASKITHRERRALVKAHAGHASTLAVDLGVPLSSLYKWLHKLDPPRTEAGARFSSWLLTHRDKPVPSPLPAGGAPPVQVPKMPVPPNRARQAAQGRVATGECRTCGREISGERLFCGPCLARRL